MGNRIAIIPIRSGSKGLKDKNILPLNGKPLVAWTIESALASNVFDKVFVSTDSEYYAEIAKEYGADASTLRSRENASDSAGSWDVVKEVLCYWRKHGVTYDEIMLLQATSPLRNSLDIIHSVEIMKEKNAESVLSVTEMNHSPLWSNTIPESLEINDFIQEEYDVPRQQLPKYYSLNGAIYLIKRSELEKEKMFHEKCFAYIMPPNRSIDIDTSLDFKLAELYMKEAPENN